MNKEYLEALERLAMPDELHIKECKRLGIDLTEDYDILKQYFESIDNSNPSEALKKLEMLSDCAEAMKEAPSSNWIEYANSETELDYKLWRAYEDLKQYILKAQEQEKVLEIIKKKRVNVANLIDWFNYSRNTSYEGYLSDYYQEGWFIHFKDNENVDIMYLLTEEEFYLLKRWLKCEMRVKN